MKRIAISLTALGLLTGIAFAVPQEEDKTRICHRTNSLTNPYNSIEVNNSAIDGEGNNDHSHHTGSVATSEAVAQALKDAKEKWGDIVPPVEGVTDGLNWTEEGQAIYRNDCNFVEEEETTPPAPQPTPPPSTDEDNPSGSGSVTPATLPKALPAVGASGR